jgi:hypothetical protein
MMGQHSRWEALFYYFRLEDQVPESTCCGSSKNTSAFAFVRQRLKQSYSETGCPSIDPELLLRIGPNPPMILQQLAGRSIYQGGEQNKNLRPSRA